MYLDQDVDCRANRLSHRRDIFHGGPLDVAFDPCLPRAGKGIELDGGIPEFQGVLCPPGQSGRAGEAIILRHKMAVAPDAPTDRPAKHVADRCAEGLADDIPQGNLEARQRAVKVETSALDCHVPIDCLGEMPDMERIPADQERC